MTLLPFICTFNVIFWKNSHTHTIHNLNDNMAKSTIQLGYMCVFFLTLPTSWVGLVSLYVLPLANFCIVFIVVVDYGKFMAQQQSVYSH